MVDLESFRWNNRVVLVFGPSVDDPAVAQQHRWMEEHRSGTDERDLVVGYLVEQGPSMLMDAEIVDEDAHELRQRFDVAPGAFRFVLIGKDGGTKCTADEPVPADELFSEIDAMPMRQREMREGD